MRAQAVVFEEKEKVVYREVECPKPRMDETLRLIAAGYLQTLPLISHRFPAEEAATAWDLIRSKDENVLGVVLEWS
jgi:bacteriochlorophyllide a dehydrogenase